MYIFFERMNDHSSIIPRNLFILISILRNVIVMEYTKANFCSFNQIYSTYRNERKFRTFVQS